MATYYSEQFQEQALQRYQNGENIKQIIKEKGICYRTIFKWLTKAKLIMKKIRIRYTEKFKQEILQKYQNGESAINIAKEKGVNSSTIFRWLKTTKQQNNKISNSPKKSWIRKFNKVSQDKEQQAKKDDIKEKPEINFNAPLFLDSSILKIKNKSEQLLNNKISTETSKQQHSNKPWVADNNSEVKIKQEILNIEENFPILKKRITGFVN